MQGDKRHASILGEYRMNSRNMAASVRAKLLNMARYEKLDFNLVLNRFAIERLLYRFKHLEAC